MPALIPFGSVSLSYSSAFHIQSHALRSAKSKRTKPSHSDSTPSLPFLRKAGPFPVRPCSSTPLRVRPKLFRCHSIVPQLFRLCADPSAAFPYLSANAFPLRLTDEVSARSNNFRSISNHFVAIPSQFHPCRSTPFRAAQLNAASLPILCLRINSLAVSCFAGLFPGFANLLPVAAPQS